MTSHSSRTTTILATAIIGAVSLLTASATHAAFQAVPYGGVTPVTPLSGQGPIGGNVVSFLESSFTDTLNPTFTGFLRSIAVDRDGAGAGTELDFYYQVQNVSTGGTPAGDYEIFSFALQIGFGIAANVSADWVSSLGVLGGLALPGSFSTAPTAGKTVYQAYRDIPLSDGAGFTFDASNTAPDPGTPFNNIGIGQVSNWLVLRTNASTSTSVPSAISYGLGGVDPTSIAPVPEPSTALLGLVGLGVFAGRRFRKSSGGQKP